MSSNTLRGIGQEGGGGDDDAGSAGGDSSTEAQLADVGNEAAGEDDASSAASLRMSQLRRIRSLDSTVPGTRSLDSSVPEAEPSLDEKAPNLAATLLGLPAPIIVARTQGTVQGRDVHLPAAEAQRNAELRPVAGVIATNAAAPRPQHVSASPSSLADPLWVPTTPTPLSAKMTVKMTADGYVHGPSNSDPGTNPWYDDDLTRHREYEDQRPNMMGRVAIGAAAAAALAVVLFAYVRLSKTGAAVDDVEPRLGPAAQPASAPVQQPAPTEPTMVSPEAPAVPTESAERAFAPPPPTPSGVRPTTSTVTASATARPPEPATREAARRPPPGRPTAAGLSRPTIPSSFPPPPAEPSTPTQPFPVIAAPPPMVEPPALAKQPAEVAPPSSAPTPTPAALSPPAAPAARPAGEKRGKAGYDPDSTLPLNID